MAQLPLIGEFDLYKFLDSWSVTASVTNGLSSASKAAVVNKRHYTVQCDASYSLATQDGELRIKFGATIVSRKWIHGAGAIALGFVGVRSNNVNEAVTAELDAGGTTVAGTVAVSGYSIRETGS